MASELEQWERRALESEKRVGELKFDNAKLTSDLTAMTADRDSWHDQHDGDCPHVETVKRFRSALEVLSKLGNGDRRGDSYGNVIAQRALDDGEDSP